MSLVLSGDGSVGPLSATEVGYLDGVTSAVQTQIDGKPSGTTGAWVTWTPTLYNMTLGNGTLVAAYCQLGNLVHGRIHIAFGSTSSVSAAAIRFSAPVAIASSSVMARLPIGTARLRDEGTADYLGVVNGDASGTTLEFLTMLANGTYTQLTGVGPTIPHAWADGDDIWATFTYEAA